MHHAMVAGGVAADSLVVAGDQVARRRRVASRAPRPEASMPAH
jgi:hypothetical protein